MLLSTLFGPFPFLQKLFADSAYQGPLFDAGLAKVLPIFKQRSSNVQIKPKGCRSPKTLDS
jgi:hypothetical protein